MKRIAATILVLGVLSCAVSQPACAENWPGWRGPRGDGSSLDAHLPLQWSTEASGTKNVAWKTAIPGTGHASPVVWQDRVFLVTALEESEHRELLCLSADDGRILWQKTVLVSPLEAKHSLNSYASSTPATDGELVYVAFLDREQMTVAAYDFDGNQKWYVQPGKFSSRHGFCSCPVLFENLVIVNGDHDGDGYLVALDRATGKTVWKVDRPNHTRSYVTPIIREIGGRTQMMLSGSLCVASYDPHDGRQQWIMDGPTEQFVASLVYDGKYVFLTAGFPEYHLLAIRPDGEGHVTDSQIAWRTVKGAGYVPSPILVGEYLLLVDDGGIGTCFQTGDGKRLWMNRLGRHYSGSPVSAGGLVYFTDDDGITKVIRPGEKFDVVAENSIGEASFASPAVSGGRLFLRGERNLFCLSGGVTQASK